MTAQIIPFPADLATQVHAAFARLNQLTAANAPVREIEAAQRIANDLTRQWAKVDHG